MPRRARQESSTGLYHVIMRGSNRSWIFQKEEYKKLMRELILKQEERGLCELYAWCIMDNHVHIVMKSEKKQLYKVMFNINSLFARRYNKGEKKVGHVFENRYKSECIEDEKYFLQVIRYVHNNPVKAKIVKSVQDYEWSSYKTIEFGGNTLKSIDIMGCYFEHNKEKFLEYHQQEDEEEYLEINEDLLKLREERAKKVMEYYSGKYGMEPSITIHKNHEIRRSMVLETIEKSCLPLRRIAEIMGMSYSCVQKIYKDSVQKPDKSFK